MQIITDDYILLTQNILSIYTNIERFIDTIDQLTQDGLLRLSGQSRAEVNNYLSMQASNKGSVFLGIFYSVDPLAYDVEVCWWLLKDQAEYEMFLDAIENNLNFDISSEDNFNNRKERAGYEVIKLATCNNVDYLPDEEDEYDLELCLDDAFMDDDDE
jgi:hypothetical protein